MGLIKTTQLANGNVGFEITYGGKEAPFGGIDSSMPPMYIDPTCQIEAVNFIIVNGQYVAVSFEPLEITLNLPASGFTVPKLGGFGNFYTQAAGYQNFAYIVGDSSTNVSNQTITTNVCLYVWPSSNSATPTAIPLTFTQPVPAAAATPAIAEPLATFINNIGGSFGSVGVTIISGNGAITETYGPYSSNTTDNALITALVNDITSRPSAICTAVVNSNGISATLTTIATGSVANQTQFNPTGYSSSFKGSTFAINSGFFGAVHASTYPSGVAPYPLSYVSEGENLILGGPGTVVLQYSNSVFSLLEQYVGANVLKKFGGSLLALGITPSPGTVIQSPEMVLAWSEAGQFAVWNPVDSDGNVTGAGFQQLADIEDPITGGFVNNSTLIILRAKGVSYGTLTGNATLPFSINHVDLASEGEGCQGSLLSSQYGPVGFYVGNANVFSFVQQGQPIGDKIKTLLYSILSPEVSTSTLLAATKACAVFLQGTEVVLFSVLAGNTLGSYVFVYNASNSTWTRVQLGAGVLSTIDSAYLDNFPVLGTIGAQFVKQPQLVLGLGSSSQKTFEFYNLSENVPETDGASDVSPLLIFPNEEISHGRDITIDGIFVTMAGTAGQRVLFQILDINGNIVGGYTFTFPVGATYQKLAEYQIFLTTSATSTITCQAPALEVLVVSNGVGVTNQFRLVKATTFGSYDPNQRPV